MAITTAMLTSFKVELFKALHDFSATGGNTFKIALIKVSPAGTYNASSEGYADITGNSDETTGTGYTAGGKALTNVEPTSSGTTAFVDFANPSWTSASFSTTGGMIYNDTNGNRGCSVHDFGGTQTINSGTFTAVMPAANSTSAILRIA